MRFHLLLFRERTRGDASPGRRRGAARGRGARRLRRARGARQGGGRLAAHAAAQPAARAGARRRHHGGAQGADPRQAARPRRGRGDARRALGPAPRGADRGGAEARRSARVRALDLRGASSRRSPRTRSASTSPPASATTRPAPTPSRAAPRASWSSCAAAIPASWGCRCTRPPAAREAPCEEILVNVTPQETRVAVLAAGQVQELLIERAASRGLVGNIYMGHVARVLPGMQSAFVEIGLERAAFLHVADIWDRTSDRADREDPRRGPAAAGAGGEGSDRPQGRAALDAGVGRRPPAGLPAAGSAHRHLAAHRGRGRPRGAARAAEGAGARRREGRLHRAHARRDARRTRSCAPTSTTCASCGAISERSLGARAAASSCTRTCRSRSACCATWSRPTPRGAGRLARELPEARRLRRALHAAGARPARALHRRAAAVRPVQRRAGDREGAVAPRRPEVGRHPGHRPDRGDDHHRRQHRRLRRQPQLRRHGVQDQPRGGAGDRAPAAAAQPRRHHHRRLHRHGQRRAPRRGAGGVHARAGARPHAHDGERLHRARAWSR